MVVVLLNWSRSASWCDDDGAAGTICRTAAGGGGGGDAAGNADGNGADEDIVP